MGWLRVNDANVDTQASPERSKYQQSLNPSGHSGTGMPQDLVWILAEYGFNLFEIVDVVTSKHSDNRFDSFFAALGVQAEMLPLFGRERF